MGIQSKDYVEKYYDQEALDYIHMYEEGYLEYPANAVRLEMVTKKLLENNVKSVLDAGCGTCGPMIRFLKDGMKSKGFDFSSEMVNSGHCDMLPFAGLDRVFTVHPIGVYRWVNVWDFQGYNIREARSVESEE